MDGSTTTKADADETPPTGRMNPEYDYLFKLLVRARDDAMRCVRAVNAFRFVSGWITHRARACAVAILYWECMNGLRACVSLASLDEG